MDLYIKASDKQKSEVCKVTKIGKLGKAQKMITIQDKRDKVESQFLTIAKKANRAQSQRDLRRSKR